MNTLVCDATKFGQTINMIADAHAVKAQITRPITQTKEGKL